MAAAASPATAQGFGVFEHGTCAMARAGAGSAAPCQDGSAIFFNPAGLADMRGRTMTFGATGISPLGSFIDDLLGEETDMDNDTIIPVPHLYAVYGITDRLTAGIGAFAPYGLATKWPDTFAGRFNGFDNELRSIYIQPTLAYQLHDRISIGAGFDFVIGSVEINQRLDLSAQAAPAPAPPGTTLGQLGIPFHTDFAQARLRDTVDHGRGGELRRSFQGDRPNQLRSTVPDSRHARLRRNGGLRGGLDRHHPSCRQSVRCARRYAARLGGRRARPLLRGRPVGRSRPEDEHHHARPAPGRHRGSGNAAAHAAGRLPLGELVGV